MEKKDYLKAKDAHKISANVSHIDEVMEQIRSACEKGYFKVLFKELAEADIDTLRSLEYKVMPVAKYYNVSW